MVARFFRLGPAREVIECGSAQEWFDAVLKRRERIVAETLVGAHVVSTLFWGIAHPDAGDPPLVFETRCYPEALLHDLASTCEEALANHARMVAELSA